MQKGLKIATISLLSIAIASCAGGKGGGLKILEKAEPQVGDVSPGVAEENGRVAYTYSLGPFSVPKGATANEMIEKPGNINFSVEDPVWVTSFEPSLEDSDGNPLPAGLVHYVILTNHSEENTLCTSKQTGNPFAAATSTLKKIEFPDGHGYPLTPSDQLEAKVFFKNPTGENYHNVFFKFTLAGESMETGRKIIDVKPLLIDLDPCDHRPISIAPGQFVERTASAFSPEAGALIKAYGLLQDFGVSISISKGGGDPFWTEAAEIDENYQIIDLPPFEDPAGVSLARGESLSLTVAYDNSSNKWFDEATGAAMVYLARTGEENNVGDNSGDMSEGESEAMPATDAQEKLLL